MVLVRIITHDQRRSRRRTCAEEVLRLVLFRMDRVPELAHVHPGRVAKPTNGAKRDVKPRDVMAAGITATQSRARAVASSRRVRRHT